MFRVYNVTLKRYEKIGRGVWLRRCDMLNSLRHNDYIKQDDNGNWQWTNKGRYNYNVYPVKLVSCEYEIYKFTDNGRELYPLNPVKEPKKFQVPVYVEEDGNLNKHKYLCRRKSYWNKDPLQYIDNHVWEDALFVDDYHNGRASSYIELHSVFTGRTYYVQLRDFMNMLPHMTNNIIYGNFTFVRYSTVFAVKIVE